MGKARAIGVGMDNSANSKSALRWAVDNLIDAEDCLILIYVQSPKSEHPKKQLFEYTGSRKNNFFLSISNKPIYFSTIYF